MQTLPEHGCDPEVQEALPGTGPGVRTPTPREYTALLGAATLGAGLMYLLDPDRGKRRRAELRQQAIHTARVVRETADEVAHDLGNRTRGAAAAARSRFRSVDTSDEKLVARVRSVMGHSVSRAHPIQVEAREGHVLLRGPVPADEVKGLLTAVSRVPGVREVENRLDVRESRDGSPAGRGAGVADPEAETPAMQWLSVGVGSALLACGVARPRGAGLAAAALGAGLLLRGAARRAHRAARPMSEPLLASIEIAAAPEEVFAFCTDFENYPRHWPHVREVRETPDGGVHWVMEAPGGLVVEWDEQLRDVVPNEKIAWENAPGARIRYQGVMHFEPTEGGGTRIAVRLDCGPVAAAVLGGLASLFGVDPSERMQRDLSRLKEIIESGVTEQARPEAAAGVGV